ncbi:POLLEN OLE E 1 ALLERGEN AND EXTENSIN FAMILY PROTEIN-RELATED [Salix viminalis]|uniref:POLLEN OLE E 1 ALLERGEN AND EXTENSIN FAMILY PROTEIN-RELATED n=1 Tax=Salix viminalis TaxID=40686 RepID=A0A9Q0U262_SALVM|nr:POLLEN OLE E 1 ALLERGEN AND EXTENSIN FAMILY PROTEIN-RELATED [Salix viminalis]
MASISGSSSYTDSCINIITAIETMAFKSLLFFALLSAAMVAAPVAEAQLGLIGGLLGLIRIQGTLFCTANGNMGANGTATPVFPNALVQLQCGGNVVSTSTTNGSGVFSILLDPLSYILSSLLTGCSLKVATPLASCDSTLPSLGGLLSSLQFIGNTTLGALLSVANIIPAGFRFVPSN